MTLNADLEAFAQGIPQISSDKKYWLIRTQSGSLYETFRENHFIAIEHNEIPLSRLRDIHQEGAGNPEVLRRMIKNEVIARSNTEEEIDDDEDDFFLPTVKTSRPGARANQIYKFIYELKAGDVVIIPSASSEFISFGTVVENKLADFTLEQLRKMDNDYILKKKVTWHTDIARADVDPFLFKLFFSHQAVNDVSKHAEIIQRSISDFIVLDEEAHLIIEVRSNGEIPAKDLFGLGYEILQLVDDYAKFAQVDVRSEDLFTTININSPGKIDLKSKIKKTTVVAGLILLIGGGGLTGNVAGSKWELSTQGISAIIKSISEFLNSSQDREIKKAMFEKYKDSLDVKNPEEFIKLMKQFSDNKDLSK